MSDLIEPQPGADFWLPVENAELVAIFDIWNVPQSGVIQNRGNLYLFLNLLGPLSTAGVCAYVNVESVEVEELSALKGEDLEAAMDSIVLRSPTVAAHYENAVLLSLVMGPQETIGDLRTDALGELL